MTRTLTAAAAAVVLATGDPAPAPAEPAADLCVAFCVAIKTACDASIGRWYREGCDALHAGCMVGCTAGD